MSRRGVVPLLTPHEVDETELGQLELLGEAVRNPKNPRLRYLVSGFSGLSTSKPSNPSPGHDVPGGAPETAVGTTQPRREGATLPMATGVKADGVCWIWGGKGDKMVNGVSKIVSLHLPIFSPKIWDGIG